MSRHINASRKEVNNFPVLPGNMQRSDVERLLRRIRAAIGMSEGHLFILMAMIDETRPSDWVDPTKEPCCYAMQTNIAYQVGKDERTVRRVEKILEEIFCFIRKEVGLNGHRCRYANGNRDEFRQGIVFTPLIEAIPELLKLEAEIASGRIDRNVLKQKISASKRMIKNMLMDLQPKFPKSKVLANLASQFVSWPTRFHASVSNEQLEEHFEDVSEVVDNLKAFASSKKNMSGAPDKEDRQYIQDTTQDSIVTCNDVIDMRTARKRADTYDNSAQPNGSANCLESNDTAAAGSNNNEVANFANRLTPKVLLSLCTEDMQFHVGLSQRDRPIPDVRDFINGAIDRLAPLGIHPSAYRDAVDAMGEETAMLCVLVIDRNRFHPKTPILNPGGVLRGMTRRHAVGKLNILQSLFGLFRRED